MKLTKRGEYGLKALIDLAALDDPQAATQIKDIARRQQIPVKFLEQILLTLKNAGVLRSRAGLGGGYYLARPPAEITLGQVVRLLDGPLAPIPCVSQMAYERCVCADEATCGLRLAMLDVRNAPALTLKGCCAKWASHRTGAWRKLAPNLKCTAPVFHA